MHGENYEAHVKVTQEWLDREFLEKPPEGQVVEWLSQTFVVPKKSVDFPWRGVGDMRARTARLGVSVISYQWLKTCL